MKTLISQSIHSLIYHESLDDQVNQIWKVSTHDNASSLRLAKEYELLKTLSFEGFRKALGMSEYRSKPALILEYVAGDTLEYVATHKALSIPEFLHIAIGCAQAMDKLFEAELVHNSINSRNFIVDASYKKVTLIDFAYVEKAPYDLSAASSLENPPLDDLYFYSPELAGHFSRKVDHRSDLFSLGVVFYQLLTGQLPFMGKEVAEVNYGIMAQAPTALRWLNPAVPKSLEDIVLKLLEKSADKRYQSVKGLLFDLDFCVENISNPEKLYLLIPGQNDYSTTLNIPEQLYERTHTYQQIQSLMSKTVGGAKVLLNITGNEGTGKSSIGPVVFQESIKNQGFFIAGKYDNRHKGTPYYAILEAFGQLATFILSSEENRLNWWKTKLQAAIGNIGRILTELIPEFEWILGEQPEVTAFDGIEAKSRVQYLFQRVIEVVTSQGQPLILFLDDMHLSDSSSRDLIKSLITYPTIRNLMIVCTASNGQGMDDLSSLADGEQTEVYHIELGNLSFDGLERLLQETLKNDQVKALAEVVHGKTGGNPLFVHQFLRLIFEKNMVYYDPGHQAWKYDLMGISTVQATQNVVDMAISKIGALPIYCSNVLEVICCLDDTFEVSLIQELSDLDLEQCNLAFQVLQEIGLIQQDGLVTYRFIDERAKQAVYEQLTEDRRTELHGNIGAFLLERQQSDTQGIGIYELAKHINLAGAFISQNHRDDYIQINYTAGKKSKEAGAFTLATEYLDHSISAIQLQDWEQNYEYICALYLDGAKAAAINGKRERALQLADVVDRHAKTSQDRIRSKEIHLNVLMESHLLSEAVDLLLAILKDLGIPLERKPSPFKLLTELLKTERMLLFKNKDAILNLPDMKDQNAITFMRLTAESASSIFGAAPEVFPLIIFKQIQLSLKYGNSMYSPNGYVAYGFALSSILGRINKGYEFGCIALELMRRYESKEIYAKVVTIFYGFLSYWKKDIRDSIEPLRLSYHTGRENGDLLYASFSTNFHSSILLFSGERLPKVLKLMEEDSLLIHSMNQQLVYSLSETQRQFVRNLSTPYTDNLTIIGDETSESEFLDKLIAKKDKATLFYFYVYKLMLAYWFGHAKLAYEYREKALQYEEDTSSRQICYPYFLLFSVLAVVKYAKTLNDEAKRPIVKSTQKAIKKLREISEYAPENFLSKYHLALAVVYEAQGAAQKALESFGKGIQASRNNGFIQEEALSYELMAQHYLGKEEWSMGELFLQKAWKCYDEWGAVNKTKHLLEDHPEFLQNLYLSSQKQNTKIDMLSMMKASQSLSSEVTLDGFLSKMLQLVMEYSNVQKVAVVVKDVDDSLILKAVGSIDGIKLFPASTRNLDKTHLPISVLHYVTRTKQYFMTESILNDPVFANDPYFEENNIQSMCCFPILKNNDLLSIIYLENSFVREAFDSSLVEFLKVLSAQIAISLENALLFENQMRIRRLENDYNQNLLAVSHQAEENERKRIAEELHDDIGALLSTTKLYLSHMPVQEGEANVQRKVKDLLDKAIQTVRNLSHRLSPISLDRFGLKSVLEGLCNEISNAGIMKVEHDIDLQGRLTLNQELQLYRISQELLNNAIKYSKASLITLKLSETGGRLFYEYKDNGVGFQMSDIKSTKSQGKGIGIHNVANRVKLINGELAFESQPGEGVRVGIVIDNYRERNENRN